MMCGHVSLWLGTVLTAPDKQRPLLPQQRTFQLARPLSHSFRLLLGYEWTYGVESTVEIDPKPSRGPMKDARLIGGKGRLCGLYLILLKQIHILLSKRDDRPILVEMKEMVNDWCSLRLLCRKGSACTSFSVDRAS